MASGMDFTDKTQETLAAAIQQAKDYANAQGMFIWQTHLRHRVAEYLFQCTPRTLHLHF